MKRAIALLFAASAVIGHAQVPLKLDGTMWRDQMTDGIRIGFVTGFVQGVTYGANGATISMCVASSDRNCFINGAAAIEKYPVGQYRTSTYGQLVEGMNAFYGDYRNRQIDMPSAMNYVSKAITGTPAADLEKMVEALRQTPH